ncbi:ribonuclease H-like domain-containing protein [Tanacetum coccineum]
MRMEQYLTFTDHALWEVIVNGDLVIPVASASAGAKGLIPFKTVEQKLARKNELKAKSTLMLAIPDEHLLKFHACKDAKSLWEAINNRFRGNKESKKMQKTILKQNYENFAASSQEGLDKTYDRFQNLISQLEIHGEVISQEDANLKFLRSLPSAWNNIALIMRNKSDLDTLGMDDLYNNLKLDNEDLEQINADDLEEINLIMASGNAYHESGYDWSFQAEEGIINFALIAYTSQGSSSSSSSDFEVHTCSKDCLKSYEALQKPYDQQSEALNKSNLEIIDKISLGYDSQMNESELNNIHMNESEVVHSVFNGKESDVDDNPVNDRFHITRLRMISVFQSAVRKTTTSMPETETSISKTSKDIIEKPKTVRPSAPIIEEYDTNNDNDSVFRPKSDQTKPKFTKINFVKSGENVKSVNKENTHRQVEPKAVVSVVERNGENVVKSSACWIWRPTENVIDHTSKDSGSYMLKTFDYVDLQGRLKSVMAWVPKRNKSFYFECRIIKKLMVDLLHLEKVLKEELKFNLFSVTQMYDKKNSVLFTETECLLLSPDFKLLDESQVLLKVPRHDNMYCFDLKNVVPSGGLTCLFAKATIDESNVWHRRLGHINFKTINIVRGLPSKLFENDHTCVACQKGKQHKAFCKTKLVSSISQPLQMLHMELFGPTSVRSINHKTYCLVVTDDFSSFIKEVEVEVEEEEESESEDQRRRRRRRRRRRSQPHQTELLLF